MERASRLSSLWSWLPAFRAVAETEHLPSASDVLHVSASSLSRTIRLLEEDVGQPLFDRVGRNIVLNDAGRALLRGVREAMRSVDSALVEIGPGRFVGKIAVSVAPPFVSAFVLPALAALRVSHPHLRASLTSVPSTAIVDALNRGDIDIAILDDAVPHPTLSLVELAELEHALCCGPTHPLASRARASKREVARYPFVAPPATRGGSRPDRWPSHRPREIGLEVTRLSAGIDACASGMYLAALPWRVARSAGLVRVPYAGIEPSTLCAMHRPTLGTPGRTEVVLDALIAAS